MRLRQWMLYLSVCFIGFGTATTTFAEMTDGEGRFYSKDEDNLRFIKSQLLSSAFKDVVSRQMTKLGFNTDSFWLAYDQKFEEFFSPIKEDLEKSFGMDQEKISLKKKQNFQKRLRSKRLKLKGRYGKISSCIPSYSIKKMSRSTQVPNARYIRIAAKVNRRCLSRLFSKFTKNGDERGYQNFYVSLEMDLKDALWSDLGVELKRDLTDVIQEHWKSWFEKNLKLKIEKTTFVDEDVKSNLEKHIKIPIDTLEGLYLAQHSSGEPIEEDESDSAFNGGFENSLWLKIKFSIRKIREDLLMKKREFEVTGEHVLIDLKTKKLLTHFDLSPEIHSYNFEEPQKLSSNLASLIYRLPIENFKTIHSKVQNSSNNFNQVKLELNNLSSVQDLFLINKVLSDRGVTKQFNPLIESFNGKKGLIRLEFRGNREELISTLFSLENTKISDGKVLTFVNKENPFLLGVKYLPREEKKIEEKPASKNNKKES